MIQIIKYKCCGKTYAACREPECYTDEIWHNDLKEAVRRGDKIEMIESGNRLQLEKFTCKSTTPDLFSCAGVIVDQSTGEVVV